MFGTGCNYKVYNGKKAASSNVGPFFGCKGKGWLWKKIKKRSRGHGGQVFGMARIMRRQSLQVKLALKNTEKA
jgi:hypothetical protein